ncbi:MAG: nuclear transport factor 2 family protein [Acidobacteriota bacterium]|nr:nuclear transport factor 2 family protein [Acidobacteriota bacterium]
MRKILIIAALCLCATSASAQEPSPQPTVPDAKQAERDRQEREKQDAKAAKDKAKQDARASKEAERKAEQDAKAAASQPAGEKVALGNIEHELTELDRGWTQAGVRGDASILERVLADDYSATNALGKTVTKTDAIADLKSGTSKLDSNTADNYSVRVFGDTAVMTHDGVRTGQRDGKAFSERYRSLHVFVKRGGRWQAVASQNMSLPQQ